MARRRPHRQGNLDGLCGVYAIVNAIDLLHPLDFDDAWKLFHRLIRELDHRGALAGAVTVGVGRSRASKLLQAASRHMKEQHDLNLQVRRPFRRDNITSIEGFYAAMERELGPGAVAIIAVTGALEHWTVLRRITAKTLQIHDSLGHRSVWKSSCQLEGAEGAARFEIGLTATMIVQKPEGGY